MGCNKSSTKTSVYKKGMKKQIKKRIICGLVSATCASMSLYLIFGHTGPWEALGVPVGQFAVVVWLGTL